MHKNDIIKLFDLVDDDLLFGNVHIINNEKHLPISKPYVVRNCPNCGSRLYVKDVQTRYVNHPILQDGLNLIIDVNQRRYICKECNSYYQEPFSFIEKGKHNSSLTPLLIMDSLKPIKITLEESASRFNVSPTYVYQTFLRYVQADRKPLSDIISIDEVGINIDNKQNKYQMVILDFYTQEPIDILPNRRESTTYQYFKSIPLKERENVKFLLCDMYNPYINYVNRYFP